MMMEQKKCRECGRPLKDPKYDLCYDCSQKRKSGFPNPSASVELPKDCVFTTFYASDSSTSLRREIYVESARKMADLLSKTSPPMTQASIRNLFGMLVQMEQRIKGGISVPKTDEVDECYFTFIRQCQYQKGRKVIPELFTQFAEAHLETVQGSPKEFRG